MLILCSDTTAVGQGFQNTAATRAGNFPLSQPLPPGGCWCHLPRARAPKDTSLPESWGADGSGAHQCTRISWCGWAGSARPGAAGAAPAEGSSGPASTPATRSDQKHEEGSVKMLQRWQELYVLLSSPIFFILCSGSWVISRQDRFFPKFIEGKRTALSEAKGGLTWTQTNGITNTEE